MNILLGKVAIEEMSAPRCEDCKHLVDKLYCRTSKSALYRHINWERKVDYPTRCGPQAKYFEPRFWVRVKNFFKRGER